MADNDLQEDVKLPEITTDLFADEAEDTAAAESSTKEKKPEAEAKAEEPAKDAETEGEEESEETDEADKAAEGTEEGAETDETETDQPKKGAEARKAELNNEIRTLNARKNELRQEVETLNSQVYQPLTEEQLVEAGLDPADAKVQASEERVKLLEFNNHVADVNANLNIESAQIMGDYPEFDPNSDEYNEELATEATALYKKVSGAKVDPKTGMIYDVAVLPYEIYQRIALTHRAGAKTGQVKGQQSTEKMLQAAETPSSSAPKKAKADPLLELWSD